MSLFNKASMKLLADIQSVEKISASVATASPGWEYVARFHWKYCRIYQTHKKVQQNAVY